MRCSCMVCGEYMVHSENGFIGCVCPSCLNRCSNCLGTDSVISRDAFRSMSNANKPEKDSTNKPTDTNEK